MSNYMVIQESKLKFPLFILFIKYGVVIRATDKPKCFFFFKKNGVNSIYLRPIKFGFI
jgi:hypothetical protein